MGNFAIGNILCLGNGLLSLREDELDVARVGHIRVDTTVGAISSPPLLGSVVNLNVLDDEITSVKTLGIGVRFGVLEEAKNKLGRLYRPAGTVDTELLALGGVASAASITAHGDCLLLKLDILKKGNSALELPSVDSLSGLAGVLERDTEVLATGTSRLGR